MPHSHCANVAAILLLVCAILQLVILNLPVLGFIRVNVIEKPDGLEPLRSLHEDRNVFGSVDLNFDSFRVCHPNTNVCGRELKFRFCYWSQISLIIRTMLKADNLKSYSN